MTKWDNLYDFLWWIFENFNIKKLIQHLPDATNSQFFSFVNSKYLLLSYSDHYVMTSNDRKKLKQINESLFSWIKKKKKITFSPNLSQTLPCQFLFLGSFYFFRQILPHSFFSQSIEPHLSRLLFFARCSIISIWLEKVHPTQGEKRKPPQTKRRRPYAWRWGSHFMYFLGHDCECHCRWIDAPSSPNKIKHIFNKYWLINSIMSSHSIQVTIWRSLIKLCSPQIISKFHLII